MDVNGRPHTALLVSLHNTVQATNQLHYTGGEMANLKYNVVQACWLLDTSQIDMPLSERFIP